MLEKALEQGMVGDDKDFFGEGQHEAQGKLSLGDNDTSEDGYTLKVPRGDAGNHPQP